MTRFRGFQKYAYKRQKPGYYLHDFLNTKNPLVLFGNKKFIIGIVVLGMIIGGTVLAQGPLFHNYQQGPCVVQLLGTPCTDPTTYLWQRLNAQPATIADFNVPPGLTHFYVANCDVLGAGQDCVDLRGTNGQNSVIVSKNPINDLSVALSKTMGILGTWMVTAQGFSIGSVGSITNSWGFYITTNNTAPTHDIGSTLPYSPLNDTNVVAAVQIFCVAGTCGGQNASGFYDTMVFVLRRIGVGDTLLSEFNGACGGSSSSCIMILNTSSYPSRCNPTPTCTGANIANIASLYLNYTGSSTVATNCMISSNVLGGAGCSWICDAIASVVTLATPACIGTNNLPPNPFGSGQFFYGAWNNLQNFDIEWEFAPGSPPALGGTHGMEATAFVPNPSGTLTSQPTIDTGGFFGPVIKALISIGVFILANIINFGNYLGGLMGPVWNFLGGLAATVLNGLSSIIVSLLNGLGSLIGDPNLGNQLVSVFTQIGSYITGLFTTINNLVSSLITFIQNSMTFLFDSANGFLTYWIGTVLFGILGVLVTISNIIVTVLKVFQVAFPFVVLADLLWLLSESIDNGTEGAMKWWTPHEILVVNVGKLMFILVETLSTFVYQTIVEIEGGAADIKPEIAGFSP